jgi:hypothetical protein
MNELKMLADVLQTDVESLLDGEVELVEEPIPAATARAMRGLTIEQQQAVLAMVTSMGRK